MSPYIARNMLKDTQTYPMVPQGPMTASDPQIFADCDQLEKMRREAEESNALREYYSYESTTIYTFDARPLRGIREGVQIQVSRVTARIRLKSPLTGTEWRTGDEGAAFSYKGRAFGVMYSWRPSDGDVIVATCTGQYAPGYPQLEYRWQRPFQRMDPTVFHAVNSKPQGRELVRYDYVALIGEEVVQDILSGYGEGWAWLYATVGEIPKGKYKGEPTVMFTIDGNPCGWISALQGKRHVGQIPSEGAVCLAEIKKGGTKYELEVGLPQW